METADLSVQPSKLKPTLLLDMILVKVREDTINYVAKKKRKNIKKLKPYRINVANSMILSLVQAGKVTASKLTSSSA